MGDRFGDTPERRIMLELEQLLDTMARRRNCTRAEIETRFASDLSDILDTMRRCYQYGLEHNEITGEWSDLTKS